MVDVLIAGGGIAGSSLAIMLGRQGISCELFEQGTFPKEKPCGEGVMPAGVLVLERLGLAEAVGGTPFRGVRYRCGEHIAEGRFPNTNGRPLQGLGQRRKVLDHVLFQAAASTPGVRSCCGVRVERPLIDNGKVVGLVVEGEARRARLVVAADGVRSRIRRQLGLEMPVRRRRLGARAHFRLPVGQQQPSWVEVYVARGHELYVTPLPENEVLVAALADVEDLKGPLEGVVKSWIQDEPELARRLEGAEQVSSLLCSSPLAGRARAGVAPGVVLLGDAAGFLDPITGGGISQALMSAELVARHIHSEGCESEAWLWKFERQRRKLLWDYNALTRAVLWLAGQPGTARKLIRLLAVFPGPLSHLIGVSGGTRSLFRMANRARLDFFASDKQRPEKGGSSFGE